MSGLILLDTTPWGTLALAMSKFYRADHRASIHIRTHTTWEVKARMKKTHTPN